MKERHPFFTWEMTRTGYVTYAVLLFAMIALGYPSARKKQ